MPMPDIDVGEKVAKSLENKREALIHELASLDRSALSVCGSASVLVSSRFLDIQ